MSKLEIKDLSHVQGQETKKDFVLGAKDKLEPTAGYYVTVFILQGEKRTHIGDSAQANGGLRKVLTQGNPSKVSFKIRAVK